MAAAAAAKTAQKMKQRLMPLYNRVLIKRADPQKLTKGGIVLPDQNKKILKGTVIATGPGGRNEKGMHVPMSVKVGDEVLLPDYGGTKVEVDENEVYWLFREADLLAKIE